MYYIQYIYLPVECAQREGDVTYMTFETSSVIQHAHVEPLHWIHLLPTPVTHVTAINKVAAALPNLHNTECLLKRNIEIV